MEKMEATYATLLGLFAEMILDEALRKRRKQTIYVEIDDALAKGDEISFLALTNELKLL